MMISAGGLPSQHLLARPLMSYDLLNRLICKKTIDVDGDFVVQYIYTLGIAEERRSVTELESIVEYTYDSLYRLTSENITGAIKSTVYCLHL